MPYINLFKKNPNYILIINEFYTFYLLRNSISEAVALSVRAFNTHVEGWMFESQPRHNKVVKTGNDNSIAKRSATGVGFTGPRR